MSESFYIREPDEETGRGPFDVEQLQTFVESGQINPQTLYYDDRLESWVAISANADLEVQLFPEKKSLRLKQIPEPTPEEIEEKADKEPRPGVTVEDLLAAAEGVTDETRHLKVIARDRERAAAWVLPILGVVLIISAATILYPLWDAIMKVVEGKSGVIREIQQTPILVLGVVDLLLGLVVMLGVTALFPLLRLRALVGAGFFGVLWWAQGVNGDPMGFYKALAVMGFGVGLFGITLCTRTKPLLICGGLALAGGIVLLGIQNFMPLIDAWRGE